ncbi:AAA family ATPase [Marivita cryptomonadis]|uniref:Tetratricopeptide repeat protein n=1 Tax=Marivita cryptomonadis TaxID=505252 RepID=A0A9Q2S4E2_9RHOB|nr:tetratricopeptide repeat protein [Marivita cryptomonadis]MCR9170574.1 tetratricopeptide repeat protein [Paracoccaceae bacterium]MBM2324250.1 tetratricopeptide repeat protein [Marivita cryptomonadis]MBM2333842.1 tetratricopeptide repeat protein [Marivita cryptomonadis]MBM2343417.1 tetratricopeptide repeat protein [Marivita cryptomonadis]MBM2348090.1 tetratricopeptide repeat protein [Marivita cryptomonadis]
MTVPSLPPKDEERLGVFGRETELASIRETLLAPEKRKILLGGISGVGKTSALAETQDRLRSEKDVLLTLEITSPAQSPAEVVQVLSTQIASSDSVQVATLNQYFSELAKRPVKNAYRLGMALLGDVAKAKLSNAEGTVKEIAAILAETDDAASTDAQAQALSEAGKDDLVLAFRELLQTIADNGQSGSIVVDGLENASSSVVDTTLALVADLPDNWCISLAVNTERTEGPQVFSKISELLVYRGGEALELRGLDRDGVLAWMKEFNPADRGDHEIDKAIEVTQGRPLYLSDWLSGTELDQVTLALGRTLAPTYQARFNSLSPQAQAYLSRLCVIPSGLFDISAVASALGNGIPDFNVVAVHNELRTARFLEAGIDQRLRPHDEVRQQVSSILGQGLQRDVAQQILNQVEALDVDVASREAELLRLRADAGQLAQVRDEGEAVAAKLLEYSPEAAGQAYEIIAESRAGEMVSEEGSDFLLNRAKAMIGVGKYPAAIEFVDQADASISAKELVLKSNQVRLKALLRLNRYSEAQTIAAQVLKLLPKDAPVEYIETLRILNTIYRDLGDAPNATSTAKELKKTSKRIDLNDRVASRVWRSLARTYAIFRPNRSVRAAKNALRFAERSGVLRDVGNAYLAVGEARRHTGEFKKAVKAYENAIDRALALGNVDSLLWSALGKADAEMMAGDIRAATQSLGQLQPFFSDEGRRHPLEALHWQLSQLELRLLTSEATDIDVPALIEGYSKLGLSWPEQYIEQLLREGKNLPKPI